MIAMTSRVEPVASFLNGVWTYEGEAPVCLANPGNADEVGACFMEATAEQARLAMDSAAKAYPLWSRLPVFCRIDLLTTFLNAVEADASFFAEVICRENGKTLRDAAKEVASGLADARYQLTVARNGDGKEKVYANLPGLQAVERSEPVGAYTLITPWNFPLATILRKLVPALVFGNTVVVKPSELTPSTAGAVFKCLEALNLPNGVANLVLGRGTQVGPPLLRHEALRGISFTGSTENGILIARSVAGRDVRLQLELGGKNTLAVLSDADLDAAAEAACLGGFSAGGQWCTGTGRVVVERSVYQSFCDRLIRRTRLLKVGPGFREDVTLGPLVSESRVRFAEEVVRDALEEGVRLGCGGKAVMEIDGVRGNFFEPTVLTHVPENSFVFREELFVPVLPVAEAADFEDILRLTNLGHRGLSASIFTRNGEKADAFLREAEAGIVHVNLHTGFRRPDLPVAAWRDSGRGYAECGRHAKDFFTRPRAVYAKY